MEKSREKRSRGGEDEKGEAGETPALVLFLFPKIEIKWVYLEEKNGKKTEKKSAKSGGGGTSLFQTGRNGGGRIRVGARGGGMSLFRMDRAN